MRTLYIDMDNTLVDFKAHLENIAPDVLKQYERRVDEMPGVFALMPPMRGRSTPSVNCPESSTPTSSPRRRSATPRPGSTRLSGSNSTLGSRMGRPRTSG